MKFLKRIAAGIVAAAALLTFCIPASAERQFEDCIENCRLYDPEHVIDSLDVPELNSLITQTSSDIDMYVAVEILKDSAPFEDDDEAEYEAHIRYNELFNPQDGVDTDGALLRLNLATRYMYIATSGKGDFYYYNGSEDNRVEAMNDRMKPYLRSEDYAGAVRSFCTDLLAYYKKGFPSQGYAKNRDTGKVHYIQNGQVVIADKLPWYYGVNWPVVLGVSGIIGAIAGLISLLVIKSSYKLKKSLSATSYVSQRDTQYYQHDDIFLRTHTSKTHISSDSGRSGGGGGGGSIGSFGGHSGGGGGSHW